MRRALLAAALACCVSPAVPAHAADDYVDCAHAITQFDMNICADKDYYKSDGKLNAVYKTLRAALDDGGRLKLRDAQRAWIQFRDQECRLESAQNEGGTIYPMVYAGCVTALTDARTRQLEQLLKEVR
ncbi:MAG: lysozyme inhibitor LprI family protein [Rhizomicrobium sp.]